MINNKIKIAICVVVVLLLIITAVNIFSSDDTSTDEQTDTTVSEVQYNEETGEYYITDENGEITHTSESEADLYIYTIDSDYNPKAPTSATEINIDEEE